jgi:propanol-preferring alcohol dehydrogenase
MKAMVMHRAGDPLRFEEVGIPEASEDQLLIKVAACAVCRTDLHVVDGDLTKPKLPLIPGHEIVGTVVSVGRNVTGFHKGERVGVPWMASTCGTCKACRSNLENLCDEALFTGYTVDGGYAEYTVADQDFSIPIPDSYSPVEAAPLLCAGLIGYRSLVKAADARTIGIYGFGAAAHIVSQVAIHRGQKIFAFTRPGDRKSQEFALSLGAVWAGDSTVSPPVELDAALIFAPVGELVPLSLQVVRKGGIVVCGGIHMSDIPSFRYEILWGERQIVSVANLTKQDGVEFMKLAPEVPVQTTVREYDLKQANEALDDLREGRMEGAAVLVIG